MRTRLKKYRVDLQKRIKAIKYHFRFTQKITGITPAQEDKLRGLIALCHAEIEDYFETVALTLFNDSVTKWQTKNIANYNLGAFFIRGERPDKNLDLGSMLFQMKELYVDKVTKNHGIKQENIHKLFYPLGYEDNDFDASFLSQLDSFGVQRGKIVHTSAKKAATALDQKTVLDMIDDIIKALEDFEKVILSKI